MKMTLKKLSIAVGVFLSSFILSFSTSLGSISPFGIALVGALPDRLTPVGLVGASLGYLLSPSKDIISIKYVAALFTIAVVRGALREKRNIDRASYSAAIAAFACLITGVTVILSTRFTITSLLICIFEAFLVASAAFFFHRAFRTDDKVARIVSVAIVFLALSQMEVWYFNLSLICGFYIFLNICSQENKYYNCGLCLLISVLLTLSMGGKVAILSSLLACIIYIALPQKITEEIRNIVYPVSNIDDDECKAICNRLNSIGLTMRRVSNLLEKVSSKTTNMFSEDISAASMREVISKQIEDTGNLIIDLSDKVEAGEFSKPKSANAASDLFEVSLGAHQIASKCNSRSGDYYTSFKTDDNKFIIMLSDGMGTGSPAALGSTVSVEILSSLIKEGVAFSCAINLTNAAILANTGDESLATIDMACIDLSTGKVDFYKAGAAATLVRHDRRVVKLDRIALPIGILGTVEFSHATATLDEYDIILMSSDGIWIGDELHIAKQLSYYRGNSMENLAKRIVNNAFEHNTVTDDITVIAAQLLPSKSL